MTSKATDIRYRELAPTEVASHFVLNHWTMRVSSLPKAGYPHHVLPDGCVSLVCPVHPGGSTAGIILVGPRVEPIVVPLTENVHYAGTRFRPEAARWVLNAEPGRLVGHVGPLADWMPHLAEALIHDYTGGFGKDTFAEAVEARLSTAIDRAEQTGQSEPGREPRSGSNRPDPLVSEGVRLIVESDGTQTMREIASELAISERQFQRRFKDAVGLTPKQFARIRRFRSTFTELLRKHAPSLAGIAAVYGFSDQAHLSRECTALSGDSPSSVLERIRRIEHIDVTH